IKQPNWRIEVVETSPEGLPKRIRYYEPIAGSAKEQLVKEITLAQDGSPLLETDLITVGMTALPHGPSIVYSSSGTIEQLAFHFKGQLQGQAKNYYPNGVLKRLVTYHDGILEGPALSYYENGKVLEKGAYKEGKQSGLWERFSPKGN